MAKKQQTETAKRFYEPICSPMRDICQWETDKDGHHIYVQVGEKNFDDEIQLYKDSCDIKVLVDKMMKGDAATLALLNQPKVYGDVNDYPEEYHPAAGAQALHQVWENQPDSVKAKFQTYEAFANYFTNLTDALVSEMFAPKEEPKVEEAKNE